MLAFFGLEFLIGLICSCSSVCIIFSRILHQTRCSFAMFASNSVFSQNARNMNCSLVLFWWFWIVSSYLWLDSRLSPPDRLRVDKVGWAGLWRASWVAVGTPDLLVLALSEFMHVSVACISGMYPSYTRFRSDDWKTINLFSKTDDFIKNDKSI